MQPLRIDRDRLRARHDLVATFGDTGRGGVVRPALSPAETGARRALLDLARARGFACSIDPIGNLFIRRAGTGALETPLRIGSHLDSQIPGGHFDGVYGVLAAFEVLETLEDRGVETARPVEAVIWSNEEGARFAPTTMGSAVHAGALALETALDSRDAEGLRYGEELARSLAALGPLSPASLGAEAFAYLEAHIEQGPVLEAEGLPIGVVDGIQGIVQWSIAIVGEEAHAGTTPRGRRKDALMAAVSLIQELHALTADEADAVRFTVGRMSVAPGAPNTVPSKVAFSIDLRHPDADHLRSLAEAISDRCRTFVSPCEVAATLTLQSPPVAFDGRVMTLLEHHADRAGLRHRRLASGATHDAKYMAGLCPTGMIFIPCRDGISHNEREWAEFAHMADGADLLLQVAHGCCTAAGLD